MPRFAGAPQSSVERLGAGVKALVVHAMHDPPEEMQVIPRRFISPETLYQLHALMNGDAGPRLLAELTEQPVEFLAAIWIKSRDLSGIEEPWMLGECLVHDHLAVLQMLRVSSLRRRWVDRDPVRIDHVLE